MPYCPKCKGEYRDEFTRCANCDIDLVAELTMEPKTQKQKQRETIGKVKPQPELGDEVPLITVDDQVQFVYITSQLERENIPYRIMERDAGQYLTIYFGVSYMGRTIYVDEKNLTKATQIVKSIRADIVADE